MKNKKISYRDVGDNYEVKDPIKKLAQASASATAINLKRHGMSEVVDSRGESAYVWKQGEILMAAVIEGLGTKNLIADSVGTNSRTYYDVIGHDTVATIINDLISVGASPLVLHAYWAVQDNAWLENKERMTDLISGWKSACDIAGVSWGGGETPTLKDIMIENTAEFGGSAVGIIKNKKYLLTDKRLSEGDAIILLKSNGINANGLSLARAIAKRLSKGYETIVSENETFGEALLQKTNIYVSLLEDLRKNNIDLHYASNITGHGLRKIMRGRGNFSYIIDRLYETPELFSFMTRHAGINEDEAYGTWNMGQDYALFLPEADAKKALDIIKKSGFEGLLGGHIIAGKRQVILTQKNICFSSDDLDLR